MTPPERLVYRCDRCAAFVCEWIGMGGSSGRGWVTWSDGIREGTMQDLPEPRGARCPRCLAAVWTRSLEEVRIREEFRYRYDASLLLFLAVGPRPITVNRALRSVLTMNVHAAQALLQAAPVVFSMHRDQARALADALVEAGATAIAVIGDHVEGVDLLPIDEAGYQELLAAPSDRDRELAIRLEWWREGNRSYRAADRAWLRYAERPAAVRANAEALLALLRTDEPHERMWKVEVARQLERFGEAIEIAELPTTDDSRAFVAKQAALARAARPELTVLFDHNKPSQ